MLVRGARRCLRARVRASEHARVRVRVLVHAHLEMHINSFNQKKIIAF